MSVDFLHSKTARAKMAQFMAKAPQKPPVGTGQVHVGHRKSYEKLKSQSARPYSMLKAREKALVDLVNGLVESEPYAAAGRMWAARPQSYFSEKLGVCGDQVRRIGKSIPLRSFDALKDGSRMTLLRVAPPSDLTAEDFARIMASEWRKRRERRANPTEYGCLVHIAKESPAGWAPDVFCTVLDNWSEFMAGTKLAIFLAGTGEGDVFDPDPAHFKEKFLLQPHIPTIRRFWHIAKDFYDMQAEMQGLPKLVG